MRRRAIALERLEEAQICYTKSANLKGDTLGTPPDSWFEAHKVARDRFEKSEKPWFVIDGQDEIVAADFDTEEECFAWIAEQPSADLYYTEENRKGKSSYISHVLLEERLTAAKPGDKYGDFYTHPTEKLQARLVERTARYVEFAPYKSFYWRVLMPNN